MAVAETTERRGLPGEGFVTVNEAADYLRLSRASIYQLLNKGELRCAKFGRARRIPVEALKDYVQRCTSDNQE